MVPFIHRHVALGHFVDDTGAVNRFLFLDQLVNLFVNRINEVLHLVFVDWFLGWGSYWGLWGFSLVFAKDLSEVRVSGAALSLSFDERFALDIVTDFWLLLGPKR